MNEYYAIKSKEIYIIKNKKLNDNYLYIYQLYTLGKIKDLNSFEKYIDNLYNLCYNYLHDKLKGKQFAILPNNNADYLTLFISNNVDYDMRKSVVEDIVYLEDYAELLMRDLSIINKGGSHDIRNY